MCEWKNRIISNIEGTMSIRLSNYLVKYINMHQDVAMLIITHCRVFPKVDNIYELKDKTMAPCNNDECSDCLEYLTKMVSI